MGNSFLVFFSPVAMIAWNSSGLFLNLSIEISAAQAISLVLATLRTRQEDRARPRAGPGAAWPLSSAAPFGQARLSISVKSAVFQALHRRWASHDE